MIKFIAQIMLLGIFASITSQIHGHAQDQACWQFSLLFSRDEYTTIQKNRFKSQDQRNQSLVDDQVLHLNGVAYIDDQHWSLWLNNQMIDNSHSHHDIEIIRVLPDHIVFKIKRVNKFALHTLHINQNININAIIYAEQQQKLEKIAINQDKVLLIKDLKQ